MSRLKKFAHSLASGYVVLGANVAFTVASVPLATSRLSNSEFGLWALTTQIAGYVALIDLGMSGSVARILIDYKDDKNGGAYGSVIRTALLVGLAQGLIIAGLGVGLAVGLGPALKVPINLVPDFRLLILGQCGLLAASFLLRVFGHLLVAHQRYDMMNYPQVAGFTANYALLWLGLSSGWGVISMLWGQLAGLSVGTAFPAWACWRLGMFPTAGRWGQVTWTRFRELFSFGQDVFLFSIGSQLINASQIIVVTRCLGLDAAATWSVCTRTYTVVCQLVWRVLDATGATLAEMVVRGERERLLHRFRQVTMLSASVAVVAAVLFAAGNQAFVQVWMHGKFGWSPWTDVLLGVWLVLMTIQRCHSGLLGVMKQMRVVKYIYFLEGGAFVSMAVIMSRWGGFPAIAASSVACTAAFSFSFGFWQTKTEFALSWGEVAGRWLGPAARMMLIMPALAAACWMATRELPAAGAVVLRLGVLGTSGAWVLWRWGLDGELQQEILRRTPASLAGVLRLGMKRAPQ